MVNDHLGEYETSEANKKVKQKISAAARAFAQFGGQFSVARENPDDLGESKGASAES